MTWLEAFGYFLTALTLISVAVWCAVFAAVASSSVRYFRARKLVNK